MLNVNQFCYGVGIGSCVENVSCSSYLSPLISDTKSLESFHMKCRGILFGPDGIGPIRNTACTVSSLPAPFLVSCSVFVFIFPYFSFLGRALD